ncbi:MAG: hypothetical protein R3A45_06560 [Bdellovibrionota bacterium]
MVDLTKINQVTIQYHLVEEDTVEDEYFNTRSILRKKLNRSESYHLVTFIQGNQHVRCHGWVTDWEENQRLVGYKNQIHISPTFTLKTAA